jgi:hypothetical protein
MLIRMLLPLCEMGDSSRFHGCGLRRREEIVVRADDAVDAHAGSIAGAHLDAAGAGLDVQIDRAVDVERAVEGAFPLGRGRLQDQPGEGQGGE